jgi:hypothetical protein
VVDDVVHGLYCTGTSRCVLAQEIHCSYGSVKIVS